MTEPSDAKRSWPSQSAARTTPVTAPDVVHHHHGPVRPLAHQVEGINHGVRGRQGDGGLEHRVAALDPGRDVPDDIERDVLRQDSKAAAAGHGLGHPLAGHGRHVRRHQRNRRAGSVVGREIHVQARGDIGTGRHQEEVGVGQIGGGLIEETHGCSLAGTFGDQTGSPSILGRFPAAGTAPDRVRALPALLQALRPGRFCTSSRNSAAAAADHDLSHAYWRFGKNRH